jgi:hypothetical protein
MLETRAEREEEYLLAFSGSASCQVYRRWERLKHPLSRLANLGKLLYTSLTGMRNVSALGAYTIALPK